jgi:hypothetical protein
MDQSLGSSPTQGPNGTGQFPLSQALNTASLFNKDGLAISATDLVDISNGTITLNETLYAQNAPIYLTTYFAVEYTMYFVAYAAAVMHVMLWHGKDIWYRVKTAMKDLDTNDIHAVMMVGFHHDCFSPSFCAFSFLLN